METKLTCEAKRVFYHNVQGIARQNNSTLRFNTQLNDSLCKVQRLKK